MSKTSHYAGIYKRFVAVLIDGIILNFMCFLAFGKLPNPQNNLGEFVIYSILSTLIAWIYAAGMESSDLQATLGKRVLGIVVTNTNGNKVSFGRATARYFAKAIFIVVWIVALLLGFMAEKGGDNSPYWVASGLLFIIGFLLLIIGYLMAAFTPEKQALHDIIARCLIVNGKGQSVSIPWKFIIGLAVAAIVGGRVVLAQIPEPPPPPPPPPGVTTPPPVTPPGDQHGASNSTSSNIPDHGNFNICGSQEKLIPPGNSNIDGDWKLEFSIGGYIFVGRLQMKADSGIMRVIFPDSSGNGQKVGKVDQTMQLYNSSQGLVLLGFNPVDPDTGNPVTHSDYPADNFLIRTELDGSMTIINCDDAGNRSPVKVEPFTNSQ